MTTLLENKGIEFCKEKMPSKRKGQSLLNIYLPTTVRDDLRLISRFQGETMTDTVTRLIEAEIARVKPVLEEIQHKLED